MGVSTRKDDIRDFLGRAAQDREAAKDARAAVDLFNSHAAVGKPAWLSPTIGAAIVSKHHWLTTVCDSCGTVNDLDLRVKSRKPDLPVTMILGEILCPRCNGHGRPRLFRLGEHPS